jgi:uncharacterized repeat protein (TIGR02543 family)
MKTTTNRVILSIVMIVIGIAALTSSCKKSEEVDKTCKVTFILNLSNAATDTTIVDVMAGELVKDVPVLTRTGFKFDGWYANSADANPDPNKTPAVPKFPAYDVATKPIYLDVILYARWIK